MADQESIPPVKQNIAKHLKAIFAEGELVPKSVVNYWITTAAVGKKYRVAHYSLNAILPGYRGATPFEAKAIAMDDKINVFGEPFDKSEDLG